MLNPPKGAPKEAFTGPRATKDEGSPDWCWQTLDYLRYLWQARKENIETFAERISREVEALEKHGAAAKIPPDKPYGNLDALLCAELGVSRSQMQSTLDNELSQVQRNAMNPLPLNGQGRPSGDNEKHDNYHVFENGTSADYLTARIARDRPDILERMKAGEFRSTRAAAIEAGIVDPDKSRRYQLPTDPAAAGRYLAQRVDREWFEALIDSYYKEIEE